MQKHKFGLGILAGLNLVFFGATLFGTSAIANTGNTTKLELKGIPLACYVSIGEPSVGEVPTGLEIARESYYWAEISLAYAIAGEFDQAIQLIGRITADDIASETKVSVVTKLTDKQQYNRAIQLVQSINSEHLDIHKAKGLAIIARQYDKSGNKKQADQMWKQVLKYIRTEPNPESQESSLSFVAVEYAAANRFEEALKLVNNLKGEYEKATALSGIAVEYAKAGNFNKSIQVAQTINTNGKHSFGDSGLLDAIKSIAAQATLKQLPELSKLASTIHNDTFKSAALAHIAVRYINLEQFESAQNIETTIGTIDPSFSAYYSPDLPGAYGRKQRFDEAMIRVNQIENTDYRDITRASVILEYARNKQYDKAQNIISTITSTSGQNRAIQALAQGYTEAGKYENAIEVLKTIKVGSEMDEPYNPYNRKRDISLVECAVKSTKN